MVAERQETDLNPLKPSRFTLMFTNTASVGSFIFKGPRETDGVRGVQNGLYLNFTTATYQMETIWFSETILITCSIYLFVTKTPLCSSSAGVMLEMTQPRPPLTRLNYTGIA